MFCPRIPALRQPNRVSRALERLHAQATEITDLTESNPTRVGLRYPEGLLDGLAEPAGLVYDPQPRGLVAARAAVARGAALPGADVHPDRVVLTASTSDAYSCLFKLLCAPGDAVLVPQPSYPLLEHLTRLDAVEPVPYPLVYHGAWEVDADALRSRVTPRTRALVVVHPNNPTGSFLTTADRELVTTVCRDHGLALITDEVFGGYAMDPESRPGSLVAAAADVLTFGLGGLSKAVGLPQLKLGWIVLSGPPREVDRALYALDVICDTYLSVSTPVQVALDGLLARGRAVADQIATRVRQNHTALARLVDAAPATDLLRADGGWYAVLQVPATRTEESLVLDLLERDHVLVHPGYFFDFPREAFLVTSLLPERACFDSGMSRVMARIAGDTAA